MIIKSQTVTELAKAFVTFQGKVQAASKDSTNPHFKSKYADLSSVWEACRDLLSENGLAVMQYPCDAQDNRLAMATIILHTSGEFVTFPPFSTALAKNDPQGVGSAITYLKRYALCAALGIVADEDDDGNAASITPKPKENKNAYSSSGTTTSKTPAPVRATTTGTKAPSLDGNGSSDKRQLPLPQAAVVAEIKAATSDAQVNIALAKVAGTGLSADEMKSLQKIAASRRLELMEQ